MNAHTIIAPAFSKAGLATSATALTRLAPLNPRQALADQLKPELVARFLGRPQSSLADLPGFPPLHHIFGRKYRYKRSEVLAWLLAHGDDICRQCLTAADGNAECVR